jgi:hypothetical protein
MLHCKGIVFYLPVLEVVLLLPKPPKVEVELLFDPKENPEPPPNAMAAGVEARRRAMAGV